MAYKITFTYFLLIGLFWWPNAISQETTASSYTYPLTIHTSQAPHHFNIELARTHDQKTKGLMFRQQMPHNAGMLFSYTHKPAQIITMWMKNTHIPLDMLFISAQGKILSIAKHTIPYSLNIISSKIPAHAVLEINAGLVKKLGIKTGDIISADMFLSKP